MDEMLIFGGGGIIFFIAFLVFNANRKNGREKIANEISLNGLNADFSMYAPNAADEIADERQNQIISVERLPANLEVKESALHEIVNQNLISRISTLSPAIVNTLGKTKTVTSTVTSTMEGDFFSLILKNGGDLAKVKGDTEDLRRGFTMGSRGIKEHAMLKEINPKITKETSQTTAMATSATANIMNVASLIVGQYYMSQVNSKLENMGKSISDISDFQDREFKSRVRSLVANVGDMSIFIEEIFEDDAIRNNKLIHLQHLKEQTTQLLEQVNLSIEGNLEKRSKIDFKTYTNSVNEFESLVFFQETLLEVLQEIGRLTFIFGKGKVSQESSLSLFRTYQGSSTRLRKKLSDWQIEQIEKQKIILEDHKFRKQGIEGAVTSVTGLIKDDWRYSKLDAAVADMVRHQLSIVRIENADKEPNLYEEDIQLLIRDGKTYLWLPEINNSL